MSVEEKIRLWWDGKSGENTVGFGGSVSAVVQGGETWLKYSSQGLIEKGSRKLENEGLRRLGKEELKVSWLKSDEFQRVF